MVDVSIWLFNTDQQVISANRSWHRFYDIPPAALPYKVNSIEETIHQDDVEKFWIWLQGYNKREPFSFSVRQLRCDDKWRIRYTAGEPVWRGGQFVGMTGSTFDITDGFTQEALEDNRVVTKRLGRNLQKIRSIRGLTQAELAALLNVTQSNISHFETGRVNPTIAQLNSFAHALKVPIGVLFDQN